jgi:cell division protein FtsX
MKKGILVVVLGGVFIVMFSLGIHYWFEYQVNKMIEKLNSQIQIQQSIPRTITTTPSKQTEKLKKEIKGVKIIPKKEVRDKETIGLSELTEVQKRLIAAGFSPTKTIKIKLKRR